MKPKMFYWKCEKCGKEIYSLYYSQFEQQKKTHIVNCRGQENGS